MILLDYLIDEKIKIILRNAEIEKTELKHPYVGTEHLLLSFLKIGNDKIKNLLNNYGLSYDLFKSILIKYIGIGSIDSNVILYTPLLRNVISDSFRYSNDNIIDETSLFFSFYYSEEGIAKSLLKIISIEFSEKIHL